MLSVQHTAMHNFKWVITTLIGQFSVPTIVGHEDAAMAPSFLSSRDSTLLDVSWRYWSDVGI